MRSPLPDLPLVEGLRTNIRDQLIRRVAGPEGEDRRARVLDAPGPRWFEDDAVIRRVHADSSMFVGGLRALLLQSLHPLAMTAVAEHSGYRGDPWGRLQRTGEFLAVTTFGSVDDAESAIAHVRGIHRRIRGVTRDGKPYWAGDPHLLGWVHVAEVDSFLDAFRRYSGQRLSAEERDAYVADTARTASALGVVDPPLDVAGLRARIDAYRAELHSTREARAAARYLLLTPPVPAVARAPYAALGAAAVASLPAWARWPLRLPWLPVSEATVIRATGRSLVRGIGWVMAPEGDST